MPHCLVTLVAPSAYTIRTICQQHLPETNNPCFPPPSSPAHLSLTAVVDIILVLGREEWWWWELMKFVIFSIPHHRDNVHFVHGQTMTSVHRTSQTANRACCPCPLFSLLYFLVCVCVFKCSSGKQLTFVSLITHDIVYISSVLL